MISTLTCHLLVLLIHVLLCASALQTDDTVSSIVFSTFPPSPVPRVPTLGPSPRPTTDPTQVPTKYYIRCQINCPPLGTAAPPCSFESTCGNGCYCGIMPGVPTALPTLIPTTTFFVNGGGSPSNVASPTFPYNNAPNIALQPTSSPSNSPTLSPTLAPTASPTASPTNSPTASPTLSPTQQPSTAPPTWRPTQQPSPTFYLPPGLGGSGALAPTPAPAATGKFAIA